MEILFSKVKVEEGVSLAIVLHIHFLLMSGCLGK